MFFSKTQPMSRPGIVRDPHLFPGPFPELLSSGKGPGNQVMSATFCAFGTAGQQISMATGCSSIFEHKNSHRGSHFVLDRFSKNEKSCEGNISFLSCTAKPLNRYTASSDRSVCIKQSFYHAAPVKIAKAVPSEALDH